MELSQPVSTARSGVEQHRAWPRCSWISKAHVEILHTALRTDVYMFLYVWIEFSVVKLML